MKSIPTHLHANSEFTLLTHRLGRLASLFRNLRRCGALGLAFYLTASSSLFATTHTWTGAVNGNWSNAGNWSGGAPAANEASLALVFNPTAANLSNSNDISGLVVQSITYSAAASTASWASTGIPIAVTGGVTVGANVSATLAMNAAFTADQTINVQGNLYFSGVVGGSGTLSLTGVQTFSGMNPYTGVMAITGGSTNTVTVLRSSTFAGLTVGGTYGDIVCLQTNVAGSSIIEFNSLFHQNYRLSCGTLDLNANNFLDFQLNGVTAGTTYSQFVVNNGVKLCENTLSVGLGYNPKVGDQFAIIKNNSTNPVVGVFGGLLEGALIFPQGRAHGEVLQISYAGGAGHDVVLTVAATNTTSATPLVTLIPVLTNVVTGQVVPIAAAVSKSGSGSSGFVSFYDGANFLVGATLSGGTAANETYFTTVGTHSLAVVFTNASGSYTSAPVNIVVNAGPNYTAFESPEWWANLTGYSLTSTGPVPALTAGPDGNIWATENKTLNYGIGGGGSPQLNMLARVTPQGAIADYALPGPTGALLPVVIGTGTGPTNELWFGGPRFWRSDLNGNMTVVDLQNAGFAIGLDGNVWYTQNLTDPTNHTPYSTVGWYTPTNGAFKTYVTPTVNSGAAVMATTHDGSIWFAENNVSGATQLGKISSTNGPVTELTVPTGNSFSAKMRGHPDGTLWMDGVLQGVSAILFRWETNGVLREFQTRGGFNYGVEDFITSPDGGVWYTISGSGMGRIGHLDVYGVSTEYLIPNTLHVNAGLALAPDGSLWYGQAGLMRFGVMAPPGVGPSKLQTTTTLSVSPSPAGSAAITCVATVTSPGGGTPTGFVIFSTFGGRVPLTNGTATAVLIASPSLQAGYCGDANYFGSLSQPAFLKPGLPSSRVANISFANSTTGVNTPTESTGSTFNVFTTMSAANFLTGGTPSGTVTIIMDDTNTLGNGTLSTGTNQFTVSGYGPGQHYLQAFYNGDANFDPIASVKLGFVGVAPSVLSATTTLSLSTNQAQAGQVVTLTATVTGAGEPESVVDFLDGTNLVGRANLHGGVATLSYVFAPGSHSLTAHYEGDFSFNTANSSASGLSVNGGTSSPPQLLFVSSPGAFVVSWPASASGFVLEENTNLGVSGWTAVGITPTTVNNQFTVTNSTTTQPAGFFRLRK